MAVTTTSAPQQQVAMPAVDLRQMLGAVVGSEGVRTSTDLAVVQRAAGANMSVDIGVGSAAIQDDHAGGGGFYTYTLGATSNVTVTGSDPTNPRVDRVVIRVRDQALGDAANDMAPVVVAGTATAGATLTNLNGAATVPGSSLLLANVLVPATSTSVTNANIDTTVKRLVNEWAYAQITANVTGITGTTFAGATAIVATATTTFDGSAVMVEFFAPGVQNTTIDTRVVFVLSDGGAEVTRITQVVPPSVSVSTFVYGKWRFAPSAAQHTYSIVAFTDAGSATVAAGPGTSGVNVPAFLRITKA